MILMNTDVSLYAKRAAVAQHPRDTEILAQLDATHAEITAHMEAFELHLAAEKFYHYVWHELADQILEESKEVLHGEDAGAREARAVALMQVLLKTLTMLHPFMPFLTETIYQNLPEELREEKFLMVRKW